MEGVSVRLGIGSWCKRSASIALPRRCHRIPPKCAAAAENWLRSCISAERGGRVYIIEPAHNPEVAGSNPAPLLPEAPATAPSASLVPIGLTFLGRARAH